MDAATSLESSTPSPDAVVEDHLGVPGLLYCGMLLAPEEQEQAIQEVDSRLWMSDLKRRVQHYGFKYDYKSRRVDGSMRLGGLPEFAVAIGKRLIERGMISDPPDQLIVNEYQPGQGIAPHVDCEPCFQDGIVTVSLGSVCIMDLTSIETGESHEIPLELGNALVFSGDARYRWRHGIKARASDHGRKRSRRISLTFRTVILEAV